jgi:DNA polymerase III delta prime subunit
MQVTEDNFLWVEKYRPQKIDDCVLPDSLKNTFKEMIGSGELQNLLLSGGAGCGKTTVAKALCNELDVEWIIINASEEGNIDTVRTKIRNFASTVSLSGNRKAVILDEFDYSNPQSTQPALRGFIEEFSNNCRFILTCNFKNRIIEPLHSRCTCIDFKYTPKDKLKLGPFVLERLKFILDNEKVKYDEKVLVKLIMRHSPDLRRLLNELQRYSVGGAIDVGILKEVGDINIDELSAAMKGKNFAAVKKWVVANLDNDQAQIFRKLYEGLQETVEPENIPSLVLIISDYQYKAAFVADQEINMTACLVQLMMECNFK